MADPERSFVVRSRSALMRAGEEEKNGGRKTGSFDSHAPFHSEHGAPRSHDCLPRDHRKLLHLLVTAPSSLCSAADFDVPHSLAILLKTSQNMNHFSLCHRGRFPDANGGQACQSRHRHPSSISGYIPGGIHGGQGRAWTGHQRGIWSSICAPRICLLSFPERIACYAPAARTSPYDAFRHTRAVLDVVDQCSLHYSHPHAYCNNLLCPNVCQAIAFSKTECQSSKTTGAGFGPSHDLAQSKVSVREAEDEAEGEEGDDDDDGESEIEIHPRDRLQERSIPASLDDLSQEKDGLIRQGPVDNGLVPREDTARRRKWFSMPAVALQTTPVFTRVWQRGIRKGKGRSKVLHVHVYILHRPYVHRLSHRFPTSLPVTDLERLVTGSFEPDRMRNVGESFHLPVVQSSPTGWGVWRTDSQLEGGADREQSGCADVFAQCMTRRFRD
ncbi:hypothetical protein V8E55_008086 [Tylopilus felleus]